MAIVPTSPPALATPPAATHAPGAPAVPGEDAIPQMLQFAQLLASGLGEAAAGEPAVKPLPRAADPAPDASELQAPPPGAAPTVIAFMLASMIHPAVAPAVAPAGAAAATADTGQQPGVAGPPATEAKIALAADIAQAARDKALPSAGDSHARDAEAVEAKAARTLEASLADAPAASTLAGQPHPLAAAHVPAPAEAAAGAGLATPVGAPGWGDELGHKLVWMVGKGEQVASLRLNPPDLGPVEIRVTLNGDQGNQATVQFASAHATVREAIETAMPNLHAMLAGSGIHLGQSSVSAESFRDQGAANQRNGSSGAGSRDQTPAAPGDPAPLRVRGGNALVDTFA